MSDGSKESEIGTSLGRPDFGCYSADGWISIIRFPMSTWSHAGRTVLEVRKPDGSPCYTNEVSQGTLCEGETFTWKDPSGQVIATGYTSIGGMMFQCAGSGAPVSCANLAQCHLGSVWANPGCQPGACP